MDSAGDREHRAEDGRDNEDMTAPAQLQSRQGGGEHPTTRGGAGAPGWPR